MSEGAAAQKAEDPGWRGPRSPGTGALQLPLSAGRLRDEWERREAESLRTPADLNMTI